MSALAPEARERLTHADAVDERAEMFEAAIARDNPDRSHLMLMCLQADMGATRELAAAIRALAEKERP